MLEKKYDHNLVEQNKYEEWKSKGYFKSGDTSKKPYSIVLPPPNVTGKLHLGHAWDVTLQDIIIRYKRMNGYDCLWLPGMDHAAIATEAKVVGRLKEKGLDKYQVGRDGFLEECWNWTHEHADIIRSQWAKLGISLDYDKERFTLDDGLSKAVRKVFVDYYNKGLIYRGEKIINWDPVAKTALSNEEVIYSEEASAFYHLKYRIEGSEEYIDVATTRPETLFGDVAVAVNKEDERYKKYVGKNVVLPIVNRLIPIITDEHADMTKGTGAVKITPAHDPNDFEVGNRHNLERIVIMNDDATMNNLCGKYEGMSCLECRKVLLEDLEDLGLLIKVEPIVHEVGHSERTGAMVEPMIKKQWFVKMRPLADKVLENQKNSKTKVHFVPARYEKTMNHWMEITYDWCISRQLWWGHRIPAWYRGEEIYVGMDKPDGEGWVQDEDVLDTWFSSALWPFSTLGWPEETADFKRYYPTDCLVTGYDIITFWVSRMALQGRHFTGKRPFKKCFIHGLIRDEQGRKMSKSLGNGIDPFDLIKEYGCDAMRYFLTTNATPGQDLTFSKEKMASSWNYINKIWNISRFIQMNLEKFNYNGSAIDYKNLNSIDKWILSSCNKLIKGVDERYDDYELGEVARLIYNFTWNDFASWYLELTKVTFSSNNQAEIENTCAVLRYVLTVIIKLLHPFMPFVTEEIYQHFYEGSIMVSPWPAIEQEIETNFDDIKLLFDVITSVRNIRAEKNVALSKKITIILEDNKNKNISRFVNDYQSYLSKFLNYEELIVSTDAHELKNDAVVSVLDDVNIIIPLKELINIEEELEKLKNQQEKLIAEVNRCEGLLNNPRFVEKAPQSKVDAEKSKLTSYKMQLEEVKNTLAKLEGNN